MITMWNRWDVIRSKLQGRFILWITGGAPSNLLEMTMDERADGGLYIDLQAYDGRVVKVGFLTFAGEVQFWKVELADLEKLALTGRVMAPDWHDEVVLV